MEHLLGARLQDLGEVPAGDRLAAAARDVRHDQTVVAVDQADQAAAVPQLERLGAGERRPEDGSQVGREVTGAERKDPAVLHFGVLEEGEAAGS